MFDIKLNMLKIGLTEMQSMMVTSIGLWEESWTANNIRYQKLIHVQLLPINRTSQFQTSDLC